MSLKEFGFILNSLNKGLKIIENIKWNLSSRNMQLELIFFLRLSQSIVKKQKTCSLDTGGGLKV